MNADDPLSPHTLRIQALHEHELGPDRIVGASTGAMRRRWLRKIQRSESAIT